MLKNILQLLQLHEHYAVSQNIEIAKGKNQMISTFKIFKRQLKREMKWILK